MHYLTNFGSSCGFTKESRAITYLMAAEKTGDSIFISPHPMPADGEGYYHPDGARGCWSLAVPDNKDMTVFWEEVRRIEQEGLT